MMSISFCFMVILVGIRICNVISLEAEGEKMDYETDYADYSDRGFGNCNNTSDPSAERQLIRHLASRYRHYGNIGRPAFDHKKQIRVMFGLSLIQVEISEHEDAMSISTWVRYIWTDDYLLWKPEDYGNVTRVILPSPWIWTPDIDLVNTAETHVDIRAADVNVFYTGKVNWIVHRRYKSACMIDVTNYPFDHQKCELWFQSLSYTTEQIDAYPYEPSGFDLGTFLRDFRTSDEWEILSNASYRYETPGDEQLGENLMFPSRVALCFSLHLRRRPGFTAYLLTLPCVVLGSMSMLVFMLPPERPDRHAVATSLFGSFMLFLLILVQTAPPSAAAIPKLGFFYAYNIGLIVLSFCLSSFVVNVSKRGEKPHNMSFWVEEIFLNRLGCLLLCSDMGRRHTGPSLVESLKASSGVVHISRSQKEKLTRRQLEVHVSDKDDIFAKLLTMYLSEIDSRVYSMEAMLKSLMMDKHDKDNRKDVIRQKWKALATVLDRLFVSIYVLLIILSIIILLPRPTDD